MPPSTPNVIITLTSLDDLDDFAERRFTIAPDTPVHIGRSSKNATKRLLAAPDNAYINSPVISREHASFTTSSTLGAPSVYITDHSSMHGTKVNNSFVMKDTAHKLHNGDTLQFGVDVIRDQESFIAKKYHFSSQVAPTQSEPSFPRGISVPSAASSDVEDDGGDTTFMSSSPGAPAYGSHANPVNVDDFEDSPSDPEQREVDLAQPASVMPATPLSGEKASLPLTTMLSPAIPRTDAAQPLGEPSSDIEDELPNLHDDDTQSASNSDDSHDSQEEDMSDDSEDNSDMEASSESADSGSEAEDEDDGDAVRRLKLSAMLDHEQVKTYMTTASVRPQVPSATAPALSPMQAANSSEPAKFFSPSPAVPFPSKPSEPLFSNVYSNNHWGNSSGPSVPTRPSAPKHMSFSPYPMEYAIQSSFVRETPNPWYEDSMFGMPPLPDFNAEYVPFSRAAPSNGGSSSTKHTPTLFSHERANTLAKPEVSLHSPEVVLVAPLGVTTPPIPMSEDMSSLTPPQNPRTKVSIAEIVEDTPQQQPPTPTSVPSPPSLKRKADDMEDTMITNSIQEVAGTDVMQTESVTPFIAARPKKRLRTTLSYLGTAAAGALVGGVAVSAALMAIPESFFQG